MSSRVRYTIGSLVAALAVCLLPTGCRRPPPAPAPRVVDVDRQPGFAPGEPEQPITFAYQDRVADALSVIAVEKGLFEAEGLKLKALVFSNGPACSEALTLNTADVGTMGDATAVVAIAKVPLKIIASHGGGEHRHRITVQRHGHPRTLDDLRGKRVAVKHGTSTHGGLLALLAAKGMAPEDLLLVDMRPPDMIDALNAGSIDAMVASEPTPSVAEAAGGRELATLGGLGNSYPILLVARQDFISKRPQAVEAFLRAMRAAEELLANEPDECARVLSEATGLEAQILQRAMGYHYFRLNLDEMTMTSLDETAKFLHEQGVLEGRPDVSAAVDRAALDATSKPRSGPG